jgi:FtsP/CotA-like multicopper oxidase with cupredoxin domain
MMHTPLSIRMAASATLISVASAGNGAHVSSVPVARPNANTTRAGVLQHGVLTVSLEARRSLWYLDGPRHSPMTIEAFAEVGKNPLMPGPLIRAPQGTELRLSVRNSLRLPLTLMLPSALRGGPAGAALDSVVIAPSASGVMRLLLTTPGNYSYRASTPTGVSKVLDVAGLLAGAIIVDSLDAPAQPRDRVLVIMLTGDSVWTAAIDTMSPSSPSFTRLAAANAASVGRYIYTINGRSWPATERIHAVVGDSLHWRIINATRDPHPMHLHGFYYRVDAFSGPLMVRFGQPRPGQMVVTQLMSPFSAMSMTWSPDRPGNWLFHCHFAIHNTPHSLSEASDDPSMRGMTGLVLGVEVSDRPGVIASGSAVESETRRLRLVAEGGRAIPGESADSVAPMHFVLEDGGRISQGSRDFSPELDLIRGQPVAITIVNHLGEPTTVHWHGIELADSYMDGVAGFSGEGKHLAPQIAPGDSFVARFTPPRAGTFMYHAHVDDVLQQAAGMEGALIVRDQGAVDSVEDHVFFLKGVGNSRHRPLEINGQADPDTVVLHVGRAARLRVLNLTTVNVAPAVLLTSRPDSEVTSNTRDTMLVRWLPVAKDGFAAPSGAQKPTPAWQIVAQGETYDFEYTPRTRENLRLEFRTNGPGHRLLIRVPVRVE